MGKTIFNSSTEGLALQDSSDQGQQSSSNSLPSTNEQLYNLLESQTTSPVFSFGSIAQKGNFLESALLSVKPSRTWIVDSGATDHMTGESSLFSSYSPCAGNFKIKIADGSLSAVAGKGPVIISPLLTLQDVLHVPNLSYNLLSVSKLIRDKRCQTHFFDTHCLFQDSISGKTIGSAKQNGGLYYLEYELETGHQLGQVSSFSESFFVSNNKDDVMLWHLRLGHPSFKYLKTVFPKLFADKDFSSFQCEICELAKHHRNSFPAQTYKPSKPFSIIHSDVWGPNPTKDGLSPLLMIILDFVGYIY